MNATPRFLNGVFAFEGQGLETPTSLGARAKYRVPPDKRAQFIYIRGGNSIDQLVYLVILRNGEAMRYFPIAAKGSVHVPLAVVEDIFPESVLEVCVGAPKGAVGTVVLDLGLLEVD